MTASAFLVLALGAAVTQAQGTAEPPAIVPADPLTAEEEQKVLHVPPGFEIQLVAAEPAIGKPVSMAFDAAGRLWVAETRTYPIETAADKTPRDTIKILSDFGEDGHARRIETFADGLNMPDAVAPYRNGAVIFSAPNILKVLDSDGDGRADAGDVLYGPFDTRDMHNMANNFRRGFDEWFYGCHGFANVSTVRGRDGHEITMSGATFRFRDDGSRIEIFGRGQVNPFGICFDPLGNVFASDCHSSPIYELLRGAFYPSFGRPDDGLGFAPVMMRHTHDSTGIAGLCYYDDDRWPEEFRDNMFLGNVVTNRVNRDRLTEAGSTKIAHEMPDLVVSEDPWFRPVDVQLGPDGAIYIADFYNRIIAHVEVPLDHPGRDRTRGRIWRVVYRGKDGKLALHAQRDLTNVTIEELVAALDHPNLTARLTALNQLADIGGPQTVQSVRATLTRRGASAEAKSAALWVLERLGSLPDRELSLSLRDSDRLVRTHALRILTERDALSASEHRSVLDALHDPDALVRRVATDALARHPAPDNLRPLLNLRHAVPVEDTYLLYAVRMALRDQLRQDAVWEHLSNSELSKADLRALADVALGVHTPEAAGFLLSQVHQFQEQPDMLRRVVHHIARHGEDATANSLLPAAVELAGNDRILAASLFRSIGRGKQERSGALSDVERQEAVELTRALIASGTPQEVAAGIELAESLRLVEVHNLLTDVANGRGGSDEPRAAAMKALATIDPATAVVPLGRILENASEPIHLRDRAAELLAQTNKPDARARLLQALPFAPGRLQTTIAIGLAGSRDGAEGLLTAITAGKASARLLQEPPVEVRLREAGIPELANRLDELLAGLPSDDERLRQLLDQRRDGFSAARAEVGRGAAIFEKNCAVCHQIGGKGAKFGPQLDGIGERGVERLTEDILDPNRNLDPVFRATVLLLEDGRIITGLPLREEGEVLVLADPQGKEVRVEKATVEEQKISRISPMPGNLADQISETEFYHLLGYLLSQKAPKK